MKRIALVHLNYINTTIAPKLEQMITAEIGTSRVTHIGESQIFSDLIAARGVFTPPLRARLVSLFRMARMAVEQYQIIGVLGSVYTTIGPSYELVKWMAEQSGKEVQIHNELAQDAFELRNTDAAKANSLVAEAAKQLVNKGAEVIVLAQSTLAPMRETLMNLHKIPVLASPELCVADLHRLVVNR